MTREELDEAGLAFDRALADYHAAVSALAVARKNRNVARETWVAQQARERRMRELPLSMFGDDLVKIWLRFGLSMRTATCLANYRVGCFEDFMSLTREEIMSWSGAGRKMANEIAAAQALAHAKPLDAP